jgi:hypothetical protein
MKPHKAKGNLMVRKWKKMEEEKTKEKGLKMGACYSSEMWILMMEGERPGCNRITVLFAE